MLPGRQDMPIWLTIVIGIVAALIGSLIASALGVGETRGIDGIKTHHPGGLGRGWGGPGRRPIRTWQKTPLGLELGFRFGGLRRDRLQGLLGSNCTLLAAWAHGDGAGGTWVA
jgi:hypothetical protein